MSTLSELVGKETIEKVLAKGRSTGAGFSEIFIEDKRSTSAGLDDGRIEQVTTGRDRGAGIRVVHGETTGFAHTADLSEAGLLQAAEAAAVAAKPTPTPSPVVASTASDMLSQYMSSATSAVSATDIETTLVNALDQETEEQAA